MSNAEEFTVTLTLDNDEEIECAVLNIFKVQDTEYIALIPLEDEESDEETVFIYRYIKKADDEAELLNIEDEKEYEIANKAHEELLDAQDLEMLSSSDWRNYKA